MSETSDGGSEGSLEGEDFGPSMALLAEMFPDSCSLELNQCLQLTGGDVAKTAEMVIHRHETGQSLKPSDRKVGDGKKLKKENENLLL